jgi:hypothetical protein
MRLGNAKSVRSLTYSIQTKSNDVLSELLTVLNLISPEEKPVALAGIQLLGPF